MDKRCGTCAHYAEENKFGSVESKHNPGSWTWGFCQWEPSEKLPSGVALSRVLVASYAPRKCEVWTPKEANDARSES